MLLRTRLFCFLDKSHLRHLRIGNARELVILIEEVPKPVGMRHQVAFTVESRGVCKSRSC
jgi:hypothetical protein